MKNIKSKPLITIDYTNWRGERALRRVRVAKVAFMQSPYYGEKQWIMQAFDEGKGEMRDFAMSKIHALTHETFEIAAAS